MGPALSSWFGFFRDNSTTEIVPLTDTKLYTEDRIGLRRLDQAGRLHFASCSCPHTSVHSESCKVETFDQATRGFLKPERSGTALWRWLHLRDKVPRPGFPKSKEEHAADVAARLEKERGKVERLQNELNDQRKAHADVTKRTDAAKREIESLRRRIDGELAGSTNNPLATAKAAWQAAMERMRGAMEKPPGREGTIL